MTDRRQKWLNDLCSSFGFISVFILADGWVLLLHYTMIEPELLWFRPVRCLLSLIAIGRWLFL
mgnify:CR=1 FL=1